jgi:hypothetical protein
MPSLPPRITSDLFYDGVWNDITYGLSQTESIEITRGTSSEGSQPDPNEGSALLQNATGNFSPKNPNSPLYGKIGRNTPIRFNVDAGKPWLQLPNLNNDSRARTPDDAALDITGDIDVRVEAQLENWNSNQITELCNKQQITGDQRSWRFLQVASGAIEFTWTTAGTGASGVTATSTEVLRVPPNARIALRATLDVDNGLGGYTVTFYTAPKMAGPWTQFGDAVVTTAGTTSIFNSTSPLDVGNTDGILLGWPVGRFYAFQCYDGINGTLVADADFTSLAVGTTAWTDSVGRSWSLNGTAAISNTHSRLVGEVPAWPPKRTTSGHVTVPIQPAGILRRLGSGAKPLKSAAFRSITFNNPDSPILEYWPWEDGAESTVITSGLDGGPNGVIKGGIDLASSSPFASSDALPTMNAGTVDMTIRSYTTTGSSQVRFFINVPSGGATDGSTIMRMTCTGTAKAFNLIYGVGGSLTVQMVDGDNVEIDSTGPISFDIDGKLLRFSVGLTQVGANVQVTMGSLEPNAAFANVLVDTLNGATVGRVTKVTMGTSVGMGSTVMGHVTFQAAETNLFDIVEQLDAYAGETAGNRIVRLASEQGITAAYNYTPKASQITMGPQRIKTLVDLMTECAESDQGFLLEARDALEIQYRSLTTMYNQVPGVILDYSAGVISPPFLPVDDDKLTRNSVVVTVDGGSSSSPAILETGRMSIQDPPDGVGLYDVEYTYSLENIGLAENLAQWLLHTGTFDGLRYTRITLDLANDRVAEFATDIYNIDVGDMIRLTNLPSDLPPDDVDLIVVGYSEVAGPTEWKITFTCIPGDPYRVGATQPAQESMESATNANNRADLTNSVVLTAMDSDDTSLEVKLADDSGVPWASAYPVLSTNATMQSGISGWNAQGGSLSWVDAPGNLPFDTDKAALFTSDGASTIQSILNNSSAAGTILPGLSYFCNGWIYATATIKARMSINWADSSNTYLSTSSGSTITIPAYTWTYLSTSLIAPASASRGGVHFSLDDSTGASFIPVDVQVYGTEIRMRRDGSSVFQQFSEDDFPINLRVDGEVMRADSCVPKFHDTFYRDVSSGWGTSDSGHVYGTGGGSATDYAVVSSSLEGQHILTSTNVSRRTFINSFSDDMDVTAIIGTHELATGASLTGSITGRYADSDNLYMARIEFTTTNLLVLSIRKRVAGVESQIASKSLSIAHVANRGYGLRFYIRGSNLKAQCWDTNANQALQRPWDLEATDTDLTTGTLQGYRSISFSSNTNVNPTVAYSFAKNNLPQVFNVERSRNGAVKSVPVGADVNVNEPLITIMR